MLMKKLAAGVTSVLAGGLVLVAPAGAAQAVPPCKQPAPQVEHYGRLIRLWWCDGTSGTRRGYHGQVLYTSSGSEQLFLRSGTGFVTVPVSIPDDGAVSHNTDTVGDWGSPWRTCLQIAHVGEKCTAQGSA